MVDYGNRLKRNRPLALVEYAYATINLVAINGNNASSITAQSGRRQVYCGQVEDGPMGQFIRWLLAAEQIRVNMAAKKRSSAWL